MANYQQDYDEIKAMQQKASSATLEAGVYAGGASTFEDQVMEGVRAHRAERGASNLTQDLGNVTGQLATYGPEARERMGDVVNPLEADVVTGRERGDLLSQLSTIASLMSEQEGTVQEVIGAGANKLLAAAEKKKAEAMQAESEANMLLQLIQTKQAEAQREAQRLTAEEELQLSKDKFEYDKTAGSGGGAGVNLTFQEIYDPKSGKYIKAAINPKTGEIVHRYGEVKVKKTVAQLKQEIARGASSGASVKELYKLYPEISSKTVKDIYDKNKQKKGFLGLW